MSGVSVVDRMDIKGLVEELGPRINTLRENFMAGILDIPELGNVKAQDLLINAQNLLTKLEKITSSDELLTDENSKRAFEIVAELAQAFKKISAPVYDRLNISYNENGNFLVSIEGEPLNAIFEFNESMDLTPLFQDYLGNSDKEKKQFLIVNRRENQSEREKSVQELSQKSSENASPEVLLDIAGSLQRKEEHECPFSNAEKALLEILENSYLFGGSDNYHVGLRKGTIEGMDADYTDFKGYAVVSID